MKLRVSCSDSSWGKKEKFFIAVVQCAPFLHIHQYIVRVQMTIMNWLADWVKWRRKVKYRALCHDAQTSLHSNCTWSARAKHFPLPVINQRMFLSLVKSSSQLNFSNMLENFIWHRMFENQEHLRGWSCRNARTSSDVWAARTLSRLSFHRRKPTLFFHRNCSNET